MTDKKKLIEVALPLEAINSASKADKGRKTGTIRNLHKWFAPMPLPALRALIFASLVDDPSDPDQRDQLLQLVTDLVASGVEEPSRAIMSRVRDALGVSADGVTVMDPFCGGGSTLVEAQRLGLHSYGSDLNPIPVLISRVLTQAPVDMARHVQLHSDLSVLHPPEKGRSAFVADVRVYAQRVYSLAKDALNGYYPRPDGGGTTVAWFWARTVPSPDPRFGRAPTPLVRSWVLSRKPGEIGIVMPHVAGQTVRFTVVDNAVEAPASTNKNCIYSRAPINSKYIRENAADLGMMLFAQAVNGTDGRRYCATTKRDSDAALAMPQEVDAAPLRLPESALGFRVQNYGIHDWDQIFTSRQRASLATFSDLVAHVPNWVEDDGGSPEAARWIGSILALAIGKLAQFSSTQCLWKIDSRNGSGKAEGAKFGRNDLPMTLDFVETNPFGGSVGDWMQIVDTALMGFERSAAAPTYRSEVVQSDARSSRPPSADRVLVVTDPPYFGAIGYANLSDYFYPWIRRAARTMHPDIFATRATPKDGELIKEPARHVTDHDAAEYFTDGMTSVLRSLDQIGDPDLPITMIYAAREQAGKKVGVSSWEAVLQSVIDADLRIVGTWPILGTSGSRLRGIGANAIEAYVALVCRRQRADAGRTTKRDLSAELQEVLSEAVQDLQAASVSPVDLVQAGIGPGMSVFTSYRAVLEPDGTKMTVRDALLLISEVLDDLVESQDGYMDAPSRWAATWYAKHGFNAGPFGEADSLARSKVTTVEELSKAGIVSFGAGQVRCLARSEMPDDYQPEVDRTPTTWEALQHMVKRLERGELVASELLSRLKHLAPEARQLAYRLYQIAERQNWTEEAQTYNQLIGSWPELARLAAQLPTTGQDEQQSLLYGGGQTNG
jgi:putative DNA methylase